MIHMNVRLILSHRHQHVDRSDGLTRSDNISIANVTSPSRNRDTYTAAFKVGTYIHTE